MTYSKDLPAEIHRLFEDGYSKEEIATALGIAHSTVLRILKEKGLNEFKKNLHPGVAEQAVIKAFNEGYTFIEIPGQTGVAPTTVAHVLKKHNLLRAAITYAGKKFSSEAEMRAYRTKLCKQIDHYALMGLSAKQIAEKITVSVKIVSGLLKKP